MNLRKLAKASNDAQKQAVRKAKEGKEEDIKVDSKILIFNLFIHFYNWSKQASSRLLIITLHVICFTAICRLASTRGDLPLISDSGCKKVKMAQKEYYGGFKFIGASVRCVGTLVAYKGGAGGWGLQSTPRRAQ